MQHTSPSDLPPDQSAIRVPLKVYLPDQSYHTIRISPLATARDITHAMLEKLLRSVPSMSTEGEFSSLSRSLGAEGLKLDYIVDTNVRVEERYCRGYALFLGKTIKKEDGLPTESAMFNVDDTYTTYRCLTEDAQPCMMCIEDHLAGIDHEDVATVLLAVGERWDRARKLFEEQRGYRFVLRKRLYTEQSVGDDSLVGTEREMDEKRRKWLQHEMPEPIHAHLEYLQAALDVRQGIYGLNARQSQELAVIRTYIHYGMHDPDTHTAGFLGSDRLEEYFSVNVWGLRHAAEWEAEVMKCRCAWTYMPSEVRELVETVLDVRTRVNMWKNLRVDGMNVTAHLKRIYVYRLRQWSPYYGSTLFRTLSVLHYPLIRLQGTGFSHPLAPQSAPTLCSVAVNRVGVHILKEKGGQMERIQSFPYTMVERWAFTDTTFGFLVGKLEKDNDGGLHEVDKLTFQFECSSVGQGEELCELMQAYVDALLYEFIRATPRDLSAAQNDTFAE